MIPNSLTPIWLLCHKLRETHKNSNPTHKPIGCTCSKRLIGALLALSLPYTRKPHCHIIPPVAASPQLFVIHFLFPFEGKLIRGPYDPLGQRALGACSTLVGAAGIRGRSVEPASLSDLVVGVGRRFSLTVQAEFSSCVSG